MKKFILSFVLLIFVVFASVPVYAFGDLDRVSIYLNGKLLGTWRDGDERVIDIDSVGITDTLTFIAETDEGGLANSSIDLKDDAEAPIENLRPVKGDQSIAFFGYMMDIKKVKGLISKTTTSLQLVLNFAPERNVPPKPFASISLFKKPREQKLR